MAFGRNFIPVLLEQEGLFTRKSSSNILSDPRILEHLRNVAQEAQTEEEDEESLSDRSEDEHEKRELSERVVAYNKRNQVGAFRITQNELDYEGALRFYFESGKQELTKAVQVTNTTNVKELLPILTEKFNLRKDLSQCVLYVVHEADEIALDYSDCPLQIAINALKVPRFVLRFKNREENSSEDFLPPKSPGLSVSSTKADQSLSRPSLEISISSQNSEQDQTKEVKFSDVSSVQPTTDKRTLKKAKRTKSFTQIASMVRKKKGAENADTTELSTYKLAPGILKVYGDHVSPGSNYKSVRASTISTAKEVVKQALDKYGIEDANPNNFFLCDVVGHFKVDNNGKEEHEEAQWVTEYMRIVNDNEKPLVVQSLWKPAAGRLRRFELVKRVQLEAGCFFINTAENLRKDSSFLGQHIDSERSSIVSDQTANDSVLSEYPVSSEKGSQSNISFDQPLSAIQGLSYLLLIKGYNTSSDQLIYLLSKAHITVGKQTTDGSSGRPDICLRAPDIAPVHCYIHKKVSQERLAYDTNLDEVTLSVFIEPVDGSHVDINGVKIEHSTLLVPGQLISIGSEYCFIFKDANQVEEKTLRLTWFDSLKQNVLQSMQKKKQSEKINFSTQTDGDDSAAEEADSESLESMVEGGSTREALLINDVTRSPVTLTYEYDSEDKLLEKIVYILELKSFKLTPAYLLTMMIEHSCATFSEVLARKFFLKVSSALQSIAWEKTKDIGRNTAERRSNVVEFFDEMLVDLAPVVTWMANSLEMLHYLQCNLNGMMQNFVANQTAVRDSLISADEELLTVLEEVIMFTFQQTVYHLTKVLYSSLPAILDSNPFQGDEGDEDEEAISTPPGVSFVINIFSKMLALVQQHMVHPQIVTQLFEYLFFFANASLFNSLMERGAGGKFYRWTKGVQIRGNLDVLEDFANRNGLQEQFSSHMKKIVAAVALLSIPKAQLMSMDWFSLRDDFPDLNASQIQQLLGEYQLSGKTRPRGWYPPPEEVEAALRTSDVLESFATHPPLLLPTTDFQLDLKCPPDDDEFVKCLHQLCESFPGQVNASLRLSGTDDIIIGTTVQKIHAPKGKSHVEAETPMSSTANKGNLVSKLHLGDVSLQIPNGSADSASSPLIKEDLKVKNAKPVSDKEAKIDVDNDADSTALDNNRNVQLQTPTSKMSKDSMSKSNVIITESKAKQQGESRRDNKNLDDEIGDVDFTSNEANLTADYEYSDEVVLVDLARGEKGLGLGLIDGLITPLASPGIYIRTIVANSPASKNGCVMLGDRILAVNGNSLVGCDYSRAMDMIINAGDKLSFLIAKTDRQSVEKILSSHC